MINIYRWLIGTCLLLLAACNHNQPVKDSSLALMKTTNPSPIMTNQKKDSDGVEEIRKEVSSLPEIYDVAVVKGKQDTLVVYKVKHLHRFKMKKIEKQVNKMLEAKHPKENFTVSSDYKIFLESVRLNEHIKSSKFSQQKAENRFKEIVKMTEDLK
ncbi:YhcN/YlaJ family sporulation lipoprotein [Neobacillus jeddahensis]|uniref:YhcN/YlaJ family sporulation lipoprotein n=1 Tax=Neobacillus jeddahensis TaxID=1461580 RepID=UPI00058CAEF6|nr:YhcN/YlaJ family sporulation lipoprotein [Neobacillus jeddahensis]